MNSKPQKKTFPKQRQKFPSFLSIFTTNVEKKPRQNQLMDIKSDASDNKQVCADDEDETNAEMKPALMLSTCRIIAKKPALLS